MFEPFVWFDLDNDAVVEDVEVKLNLQLDWGEDEDDDDLVINNCSS